jgi:hypothetical protein
LFFADKGTVGDLPADEAFCDPSEPS